MGDRAPLAPLLATALTTAASNNRYHASQLPLLLLAHASYIMVLFLKALVFLYAFEESVDCHLLSSFCEDSNLHISLFKYVLSTMGVSKESISKFLKEIEFT